MHVTWMQKIETTVREDDALAEPALVLGPFAELLRRQQRGEIGGLRALLAAHSSSSAMRFHALRRPSRSTTVVPSEATATPAAAFAIRVASSELALAAKIAVNTAITVSPAPVTS